MNGVRPSVAIIGGGWAGLSCALKLAQAGFNPVVYESAPEAGGRARRAKFDAVWRDNGQHLMLAGCRALTELFKDIGVTIPSVPFAYSDGNHTLSLSGRYGRIGLLLALLQARGFSWSERFALLRALLALQRQDWQTPTEQTVAHWLSAERQPASLIHAFWTPLALAILNTPIASALMARLAPVLRDTLGVGADALRILQPPADLSHSVVEPLVGAIEVADGQVLCGQRVLEIQTDTQGAYTLRLQHHAAAQAFDQVVLAVVPWSLARMALPASVDAPGLARRFGAQPIATVYLGFDADVRLRTPLLQIPGPTEEDARVWAMDRRHCGEPGVIAISLSAEGAWTALDHETLVERCIAHLRAASRFDTLCRWHKVVTVQRATPLMGVTATLHPQETNPQRGLWLAGDWTHPEYPATLEAAVQTGFATAEKIIASAG